MSERWPTVAEIAQRTGYHPEHIRRLIRWGKIRHEQVGRIYLVDPDSVAAYIQRAKQHPRGGPRGGEERT